MIPLPDDLAGVIEERVIRLDRALFYVVNAALTALVDRTTYEQTGTLTAADALAALEAMLADYFA